MGVSISLLFVRGREIAEVLDCLALAATQDRRATPLIQRGVFVMAALPSGYKLIWSNTCDEPRFSPAILAKLSADGETVVLAVEEHVMFSQAQVWRDGRLCWSLRHDGDVDATNLTSSGDLPPLFGQFRREQEALAAADQDFFDIPVKLAEHITGFRYDQNHAWEVGDTYTVLAAAEPAVAGRPFWKFW